MQRTFSGRNISGGLRVCNGNLWILQNTKILIQYFDQYINVWLSFISKKSIMGITITTCNGTQL